MWKIKRFSVSLVFCLFFVGGCSSAPRAQTGLTTLRGDQGGMVVYGLVNGATTPAMAMAHVLRDAQNNCGEKPQVGRVFRVRGSNSDAVFFTVTNHLAGNLPLAGMVIASQTGPKTVEAALVSDASARFGSTMNPLLRQLFGVWHPGGAEQASGPATGGHSALAARLHTVTAPDNSGSIGIPDGWTMNPATGHGAIVVLGPQGEVVALNMHCDAVDPTSQWQRNFWRQGGRPNPGTIIFPHPADLGRAVPDLIQAWRRAGGQGPAKLQIDKINPGPVAQGMQCVQVTGHMDPDGRGMKTMNDQMCTSELVSWGGYMVTLHHSLLSNSPTEQEKATWTAMLASWKLNKGVLDQQLADDKRAKAASDQATLAWGRQVVNNINQIGATTSARIASDQQIHDAQHETWRQGQEENSRSTQGFSNYILDQTVVQDNNMYGNGTIGHGTLWNSQADALVKANPNRFEYVTVPNYWRGTDFVP